MQLKKKIKDGVVAGAFYTQDGIALRLAGKDDKFMNSIALVECVDGELRLTLFDDAIQRYGIKIQHENVSPVEW